MLQQMLWSFARPWKPFATLFLGLPSVLQRVQMPGGHGGGAGGVFPREYHTLDQTAPLLVPSLGGSGGVGGCAQPVPSMWGEGQNSQGAKAPPL